MPLCFGRFCYQTKQKVKKFISKRFKPQKFLGDKTRKSKRWVEAIFLAQKIYEIENAGWRTRRDWLMEGKTVWELAEGITMQRSEDCMVWYVWRTYDDQAREFCKSIPAFSLRQNTLERLLYDQPWVCI